MSGSSDRDVVAELARRLELGEDVLLATAVRTEGEPPCQVGQKLLLSASGPLAGTLGCSELDSQAAAEAGRLLSGGVPEVRILEHDLGKVETYMEPYTVRPLLVVLGATPVAEWLLRWAPALGYDTVLVESRQSRITPALAELAGSVAGSPPEVPALRLDHQAGATARTSPADGSNATARAVDAVHTDHDAPDIAEHLAMLLASSGMAPSGLASSGARFVGVMGSARHVAGHLDELARRGVAESDISRIQSPVGLNLGGMTPPEMALSILAGLVAARNGRSGGWLDDSSAKRGGSLDHV